MKIIFQLTTVTWNDKAITDTPTDFTISSSSSLSCLSSTTAPAVKKKNIHTCKKPEASMDHKECLEVLKNYQERARSDEEAIEKCQEILKSLILQKNKVSKRCFALLILNT